MQPAVMQAFAVAAFADEGPLRPGAQRPHLPAGPELCEALLGIDPLDVHAGIQTSEASSGTTCACHVSLAAKNLDFSARTNAGKSAS